jgi:hypothetical protein
MGPYHKCACLHRAAVLAAAAPLHPTVRPAFLEMVAATLAREPAIGDGAVHRACREAQRALWRGPELHGAAAASFAAAGRKR